MASLLAHVLLLGLSFGHGAGLPGLVWPWQERRGEVPDLRVVLPQATEHSPAAEEAPAASAGDPPRAAAETLTLSAPAVATLAPSAPEPESAPPPEPANTPVPAPQATAEIASEPTAEAPTTAALAPPWPDWQLPTVASSAQAAAPIDSIGRLALPTLVVPVPVPSPNLFTPPPEPRATPAAPPPLPPRVAAAAPAASAPAPAQTERQEAARQELARQELARLRTAELDAARREAERQEAARRDAQRLEAQRLEAEREQAARQAALREEALRVEVARQEAARQEAAKQEAARQDALRQEAARQEAARLEAARAEAARVQAIQDAAARREAVLRAIGRQLDEEAARRDAATAARPGASTGPQVSSYRRGRLLGRSDNNAELVLYGEAFARKIQLNMTFDLVREAARQPHTQPVVTVAIRSDGSVESVSFVRSSGVPAIDEAVLRIVHSQAPYAAFPPALASDYDVIEIRRTWHFDMAVRLY